MLKIFNIEAEDRDKFYLSLFFSCGIGFSFGYFLYKSNVPPQVLQEFYKALIPISGIFLAFSPSFYVFLISNDELLRNTKSAELDKTLRLRFTLSAYFAISLLLASLMGIIFSYGFIKSEEDWGLLNFLNFSFSITLLSMGLIWLNLYVRMIIKVINNFRDV